MLIIKAFASYFHIYEPHTIVYKVIHINYMPVGVDVYRLHSSIPLALWFKPSRIRDHAHFTMLMPSDMSIE